MKALLVLGSLSGFTALILGFIYYPIYTAAYLVVCTLFFFIIEIDKPKNFEDYYIFAVVWLLSPFFFWWSL